MLDDLMSAVFRHFDPHQVPSGVQLRAEFAAIVPEPELDPPKLRTSLSTPSVHDVWAAMWAAKVVASRAERHPTAEALREVVTATEAVCQAFERWAR
jgi:hypothetical protein